MSAAVAQLKDEWRQFRGDQPGERFEKHRERMQQRSKAFTLGLTIVGILFVLAGVVFLVIPGPGTVAIMFGLGLIAGQSRRLAALLDRVEPWLRTHVRAARERWRTVPGIAKAALMIAVAATAAGIGFGLWRVF